MAGLEADTASVYTPETTGRASAARMTNKLRDSCQACAMSKVKCPKEKPACSRCESRSLACEYVFTRRPGRRRETKRRQSQAGTRTKSSSSSDTENGFSAEKDTIQALQPPSGIYFLSPATMTPSGISNFLETSPQNFSIPSSPRPDPVFVTEADEFSAAQDANMLSTLAEFDPDSDDINFIMSSMKSPFVIPAMDSCGMAEPHNDIGSLLIPPQGINIDHPSSDMSYSVIPKSPSTKITEVAPDIEVLTTIKSGVAQPTDTSPFHCLTQSLDLLKSLSAPSLSRTALSSLETRDTSSAFATMSSDSVLAQNKQSIEDVSERLACAHCSGDNFLLAILSMTVLKILERYAAAARVQPHGAEASDPGAEKTPRLAHSILASSNDQMMVLSRTYSTSQNRGHKAAQLVLSELHRVQRLINQLSTKLKRPKEGDRWDVAADLELWGRHSMAREYNPGRSTPFSATTLDQMESDVRKSLSTLSSEIIKGLRQN